jgi:hypothetical protein
MNDPTNKTPLEHLLETLNNPLVGQARKDKVAESLLPYLHPRLSATATISAGGNSNNNNDRPMMMVGSVPRGSSINLKTGEITFPPGAGLEPFAPFKGTHDWTATALTDQRDQQEPEVERLEVTEIDTTNVTVLRRRDDSDDSGPNAA